MEKQSLECLQMDFKKAALFLKEVFEKKPKKAPEI